MAMRRDQREGQEVPPEPNEEKVVGFPKEVPSTGTRPEMLAIGGQVIAKRRRLLERLAAYDRGDDPGH
jgi:hypothetical protein